MRIAQVAPLYESVPPKYYGGTERVVSYLTEELVRRGVEVSLFASGDSRTSAELAPLCHKALRLDDAVVEEVPPHIVALHEIKKREQDFDLIHFHTPWFHFQFARSLKVPHLSTIHNGIAGAEFEELFNCFSDIPVVSISRSHRAPRPQGHWISTVYHGLPEDLYSLGDGSGGYAAFIGRFSPEKGPDRAIAIAKQAGIKLKIAAKMPDCDRDKLYFDEKIKPFLDDPLIEYVGEIGEAEKGEFLGKAMCLLFPINWSEPFGMVLIEAMANGTPVIAFRYGSVPEVIDEGISGMVVSSIDEAVRAVERAAAMDRKRCREQFDLRFTARRMGSDYIALYEKLIAQRSIRKVARTVVSNTKIDAASPSSLLSAATLTTQ